MERGPAPGRARVRGWGRRRVPLHDAKPEGRAERRRGSFHSGDPRSQRPTRPPRSLRKTRPAAVRLPPSALFAGVRLRPHPHPPTCPRPLRAPAHRAPRPPGTPSRPARPKRARRRPAGLSDPRSGAVLLSRSQPWTCAPHTGWGCPAHGPPAALAAGRPPSGTRGRGRRGAGGRAGGCGLLGSGDASRRRAWPDMASLRTVFS